MTIAPAPAARASEAAGDAPVRFQRIQSSGTASTRYCFDASIRPAIQSEARERPSIAKTVNATKKTATGSVHPCSSTKNTRGVVSSSAAARRARSEGRVYAIRHAAATIAASSAYR